LLLFSFDDDEDTSSNAYEFTGTIGKAKTAFDPTTSLREEEEEEVPAVASLPPPPREVDDGALMRVYS
jgi:hypothetical protein